MKDASIKNVLGVLVLLGSWQTVHAQDAAVLAEQLRNGDGQAGLQLAKQGAKAVPALVGVLKDGESKTRGQAAYALALIGPPAKEAVDELVRALNDEEPSLRAQAAFALGKIGPEAGPAVV